MAFLLRLGFPFSGIHFRYVDSIFFQHHFSAFSKRAAIIESGKYTVWENTPCFDPRPLRLAFCWQVWLL